MCVLVYVLHWIQNLFFKCRIICAAKWNTCLYIYECLFSYIYLCLCVSTFICVCVYVCVDVCMYTYIYTYICTYVQIYRMHSAYRMYSVYVHRTYSILESSPAEPNVSCVFARACVCVCVCACVCVCVSLNVAQSCRILTMYIKYTLPICWNRMEWSLLIFRRTIRQLDRTQDADAFCIYRVHSTYTECILHNGKMHSTHTECILHTCRTRIECSLHIQNVFYIHAELE